MAVVVMVVLNTVDVLNVVDVFNGSFNKTTVYGRILGGKCLSV